MLPTRTKDYALKGLRSTPAAYKALLGALGPADPRWDYRPDPERLTLREIIEHMAMLEKVWRLRCDRALMEEKPYFPSVMPVPGQSAAEFETTEPFALLQEFSADRKSFVDFLTNLEEDELDRVYVSESLGEMAIRDLVVFAYIHDGYHSDQIIQWLELWESRKLLSTEPDSAS